MSEYAYKEIIIDPTSEEARNCIGKMVYYADNPSTCLSNADNEYDNFCDILLEIDTSNSCPFVLGTRGTRWQCIIARKEEPKPEYIPFKDREEFLNYYAYHKDKFTKSSLAHQISTFGGIFLKDEYDDYYMVTEILKHGIVLGNNYLGTAWKDVLDRYLFLDGTPCGKVKENNNG